MMIQLASGPAPGVRGNLGSAGPDDRARADTDLLVPQGDIDRGTEAIEVFAAWPMPMLYLAANHELYGHGWEQTRTDLRSAGMCTTASTAASVDAA